MNWSGYVFDPQRTLLIVNTNNLMSRVRLIPRDKVGSDNEDGNYGPQRRALTECFVASCSRHLICRVERPLAAH